MGPVPFEDVLESRLTDLRINLVHHHKAEVADLQGEITTLRSLLSKDGSSLTEVQRAALKCHTSPSPPDEAPPELPPIDMSMPRHETEVPGEILDVLPTMSTSLPLHKLRQDNAQISHSQPDLTWGANGFKQAASIGIGPKSSLRNSIGSESVMSVAHARGLSQPDDSTNLQSASSMTLQIVSALRQSQERHSTGHGTYRSSTGTNDQDHFTFTMLPVWNDSKRMTVVRNKNSKNASFANIAAEEDDSDEDSEIDLKEAYLNSHCISGFTSKVKQTTSSVFDCLRQAALFLQTSPNAMRRVLWDLAGVLLIVYEFVVLPLQLLDLPESVFLTTMGWVTRCYWTLDFPASFFKSYHQHNGALEKRPERIAMKYVRTWMFFDLAIIIIDWLDAWSSVSAARMGKFVRLFRWMRMVRLFRLLRIQERLPDFARAAAYFMHSERFTIVMAMIKMIVFLLAMAHLIACLWFGLGIDSEQETTWVKNHDRVASAVTLEHRYAESMHWALTQFAGAADIYPTNFQERMFAIAALVFGFLISVSVVSSLTSNLTRLQIVTARSATQMSMLNQYLYDNHISTKIALRVQRNVMYALEQETKNTPESSIELLNLVSGPLRVELHYEINLPILSWHHFFSCYNLSNSPSMRRVCHMAFSRLALCRGDILFNQGEIPPKPSMFFCLSGKFHYQRYFEGGLAGRLQTIRDHQMFCEQVLWTQWVHLGQMRARMESNLLVLNAEQFQSIASQFQTREFYPKKYAQEYVDSLTHTEFDEITDVGNPEFNLQEVCMKIFPAAFTRHLYEHDDKHRWSAMNLSAGNMQQRAFNLTKVATKGKIR